MPISYSGSERGSVSSSPYVSLCRGMMGVEQRWKGTTVAVGAPMVWCSGWRRQNGDTVEWWKEWPRLRWPFYSSGEWESDCPGKMTDGGETDSMLRFRLERVGDRTKHCLVLAPWEGSVTRRRGVATSAGGEVTLRRGKGGDDTSWAEVNVTGPKTEENPRGRVSCYKLTVKI
jgi:hypothetical protein